MSSENLLSAGAAQPGRALRARCHTLRPFKHLGDVVVRAQPELACGDGDDDGARATVVVTRDGQDAAGFWTFQVPLVGGACGPAVAASRLRLGALCTDVVLDGAACIDCGTTAGGAAALAHCASTQLHLRFTSAADAGRFCADVTGDDAWVARVHRSEQLREALRALSPKPFTRWWWLHGPFTNDAIAWQLTWLADNGFGGVELAFLDLSGGFDNTLPEWLSPAFTDRLAFAKAAAHDRGLRCDATLGSCWPFGGTGVTDDTCGREFNGRPHYQRMQACWKQPGCPVPTPVNHLNAAALDTYATTVLTGGFRMLADVQMDRTRIAALFCDSLELHPTDRLWDPALNREFRARYGYEIAPKDFYGTERAWAVRAAGEPGATPTSIALAARHQYDYRSMRADAMQREFYAAFTGVCHAAGAWARVQCHGAPAGLLDCYAAADIPETEALLFPPAFSRIAASAAAFADRPVVSCETFTCIYGFPRGRAMMAAVEAHRREDVRDLKLLFDSLVAHGVNHVVWHGTPFNGPDGTNEFYASVHVGAGCAFAAELPAFNAYMARVCGMMRAGLPWAQLAVLLPDDDAWLAGELDDDQRTPAARCHWEQRYTRMPGVDGHAALWVSAAMLAGAECDGASGSIRIDALCVDAIVVPNVHLSADAAAVLRRLCDEGARVVVAPCEGGEHGIPVEMPCVRQTASDTDDLVEYAESFGSDDDAPARPGDAAGCECAARGDAPPFLAGSPFRPLCAADAACSDCGAALSTPDDFALLRERAAARSASGSSASLATATGVPPLLQRKGGSAASDEADVPAAPSPSFFARQVAANELRVFVSHPACAAIAYPMPLGFAAGPSVARTELTFDVAWQGLTACDVKVCFEAQASVVLAVCRVVGAGGAPTLSVAVHQMLVE